MNFHNDSIGKHIGDGLNKLKATIHLKEILFCYKERTQH